MLKKVFIFFSLFSLSAHGDFDKGEPLLYPSGFETADTLRSTEWFLAPPPWGWIAYGAGKYFTIGFDYPAALFGVAGGVFRFQIPSQNSTTKFAIEAYGAYFPTLWRDTRNNFYILEHRGGQEWLRLNISHRLSSRWRMHFYVGANYTDYERYTPNLGTQFTPKLYENQFTPNAGLALEWQMSDWLIFNANTLYGNTFYYVDQVARKYMTSYSLVAAPFPKSWWGIFDRLRLEATALFLYVPDANHNESLPLPLYITAYWQFGGD